MGFLEIENFYRAFCDSKTVGKPSHFTYNFTNNLNFVIMTRLIEGIMTGMMDPWDFNPFWIR